MSLPHPFLVIEPVHPSLHVDRQAIEQLVVHVLAAEGYSARYIGLILTDHVTVCQLNQQFLGRDYVTDVLAFDLRDAVAESEARAVEGEVYVDLDTAAERAPEFGSTFEKEVYRYVIHGLLHLMGYDDSTPAEKQIMHALEDRYLSSLAARSSDQP